LIFISFTWCRIQLPVDIFNELKQNRKSDDDLVVFTNCVVKAHIKHYHRRTAVQPCVNGDWLSQWRMAKFNFLQIRDLWTNRHNIWYRWLRACAKFCANPSIGGSQQMGEI